MAGLNPQRFPELKATAWEYVYDPYILGRTWALLSLRDHLRLPEDIDLLVQAVYDEEVQLPAEITERDRHFIEVEAYGKRLGERRTERMMATNVAIAVEDEPQLAYTQRNRGYQEGEEGLGLPNYTRLGDESVSLVPVYRLEGGWSLSAGENSSTRRIGFPMTWPWPWPAGRSRPRAKIWSSTCWQRRCRVPSSSIRCCGSSGRWN